jgi:hypothetical protein
MTYKRKKKKMFHVILLVFIISKLTYELNVYENHTQCIFTLEKYISKCGKNMEFCSPKKEIHEDLKSDMETRDWYNKEQECPKYCKSKKEYYKELYFYIRISICYSGITSLFLVVMGIILLRYEKNIWRRYPLTGRCWAVHTKKLKVKGYKKVKKIVKEKKKKN